ncbi:MAG: fibronectin type III domain-containing protein [Chloroflexota bacterium]
MPRRLLSLMYLAMFTAAAMLTPILGEPFSQVSGGTDASHVAHAQAGLPPMPSSWPSTLPLGRADAPGGAAAMKAQAPFAFRYQYLAAGVNTGNGWANWNPNGQFVTYYIQDSVANGMTPVFTYYMIYQSLPGGGSESQAVLGNLNNTATMQAYYADLKLFFQRAGAFPNNKVVLHVEPDMWGYVQQAASNDNAATVPAKVGSTGVAEVAGLPDNVAGLAQGIVRMRNQYAPNVILAYHVSVWGTGVDISMSDPADSQVDQLGNRAGAFYNSVGAPFDVAFGEYSDRDSGFKQAIYGQGAEAWWNAGDFSRFARFISRFVSTSGKRMVLWQIPLGNTKMRAVNNTWNHYQDNRVEWLLDEPARTHLTEYINAGVIGFMFGRGADGATNAADSNGDGVTNPAAINGNTQTSYNADDDGGFFHNRAAAYYQAGPLSLPGGSAPPATATPIPTATAPAGTPVATVAPGGYVSSAVSAPASVSPGASTTITASVTSGSAVTALVDVEVYSAAGAKVYQTYLEDQPFLANQPRTFPVTWNVPAGQAAGAYTVKIGVFSPGWAANLHWNNDAGTVTVGSGSAPTSTPTAAPPTATPPPPTATPVPPTATPTFTPTPLPPTATPTSVPPTATSTQVAPSSGYTTSATVSPASVTAGGATTITASVTSGSASSILVDVEVYSAAGVKMHQQWFDTQAFAAGQTRTFPVTWNVPAGTAAGTYAVMIGVFSPGWGTNYHWNGNAASVTVTAGGDTTAPVISGVDVTNIARRSATVRWTTNEAATHRVEYGTTPALGSVKTASGRSTSHAVGLSGLTANTTYHYRVVTADAAGNTAVSDVRTFTTSR